MRLLSIDQHRCRAINRRILSISPLLVQYHTLRVNTRLPYWRVQCLARTADAVLSRLGRASAR